MMTTMLSSFFAAKTKTTVATTTTRIAKTVLARQQQRCGLLDSSYYYNNNNNSDSQFCRSMNYQVFLQKYYDPIQKKVMYEDWDIVMRQFSEPMKYRTGKSLLSQYWRSMREGHVKPTEQRRRDDSHKHYQRSNRQVDTLLSYIQFQRSGYEYGNQRKQELLLLRTQNPLGYTNLSNVPSDTSTTTTGTTSTTFATTTLSSPPPQQQQQQQQQQRKRPYDSNKKYRKPSSQSSSSTSTSTTSTTTSFRTTTTTTTGTRNKDYTPRPKK
jgi:hypothetical protein